MAWDIALDPIFVDFRERSVRAACDAVGKGSRKVGEVEQRLKALMLLGLAGDAAAQASMLDTLARLLRAYFGRRIGADAADLEDLVQETLIAVHQKRYTFDETQPFTPWAYAIARYKLADYFRRNHARREAPLENAGDLIDPAAARDPDAAGDLARLLAALPERQRKLVMDVKVAGLSIEEASAKSGMSNSAVKVSIHRAINAMARRFRDADR